MTIDTALEHHLAGRLAQAEALYRELLVSDPRHANALYLSGVLAQQTGNKVLAHELFLKAIDANPTHPLYYRTLGDLQRDKGEIDDAVVRYRQALLCQPDDIETLGKLAELLQQQHQFEAAIDCYRKLLALDPAHAQTHNNLGVALMAWGQLDDAVLSFKQALALKPDFCESINNLGVAYKNQGRMEEALACYHQALALNPNYAKALFNLGTTYFIKKDYEQAAIWYRASLAIDPDQVEAHQNMAAILLEAGKLDEAQQHRDLAYRRQSFFIDSAPHPVRTVLVLWAAGKGNIPIEFLLPVKTFTRIVWMMEYATEEQARKLPPYDLVFNAIGDPDVTGPTSKQVEWFLQTCDKPVFNLPAAVERTARDRIPALFKSIANAVVPVTVKLDPKNIHEQLLTLPEVQFPAIVRPSGSHGGDHLVKLESAQDLSALVTFNAAAYYATNYLDYRSDDGYYRKYRMLFIDRQPYPYHLAINDYWLVHYETADMLNAPWKLAEEARFLEAPATAIGAKAMATVEAIARALDLDYCGLDFSVLKNGRVLVFEANATMLVHPEDESSVLAFKNPLVKPLFEAFNAMIMKTR